MDKRVAVSKLIPSQRIVATCIGGDLDWASGTIDEHARLPILREA